MRFLRIAVTAAKKQKTEKRKLFGKREQRERIKNWRGTGCLPGEVYRNFTGLSQAVRKKLHFYKKIRGINGGLVTILPKKMHFLTLKTANTNYGYREQKRKRENNREKKRK